MRVCVCDNLINKVCTFIRSLTVELERPGPAIFSSPEAAE